MKVIDFSRKGNVVRFYLGADDLEDYYGDDWDDAPYDCNAGEVYERYVSAYIDVSFPFDSAVLEPCNGVHNCCYAKDDMKDGIVPCIIVVPKEMLENAYWHDYDFSYWVGSKDKIAVYFNDPVEKLVEKFGDGVYYDLRSVQQPGDAA